MQTKKCPHCGSEIYHASEYCPYCKKNAEGNSLTKKCPHCGSEIYHTSKYCTYCKNEVGKSSSFLTVLLSLVVGVGITFLVILIDQNESDNDYDNKDNSYSYSSSSDSSSYDDSSQYSWIVGKWRLKTPYGSSTIKFDGNGKSGSYINIYDDGEVESGTYKVSGSKITCSMYGASWTTAIEIHSGNRLYAGGGTYYTKIY